MLVGKSTQRDNLRNFRSGSTTDSRDPPLPRPLSGGKQTKSVRKRTLPHEGRLHAQQRKWEGLLLNNLNPSNTNGVNF